VPNARARCSRARTCSWNGCVCVGSRAHGAIRSGVCAIGIGRALKPPARVCGDGGSACAAPPCEVRARPRVASSGERASVGANGARRAPTPALAGRSSV
jgi:hypothetical protein